MDILTLKTPSVASKTKTTAVALIGAGGHTRSLLNVVRQEELIIKGIFDANARPLESIFETPVMSDSLIPPDCSLILSAGDNHVRATLYETFKDRIYTPNLVHKNAYIEEHVTIGQANQILHGSYINSGASVGINNLINSFACLEHEASIGDHNHISVRATIAGRSKIGSYCFIGAGAVVIDGVSICDHVTIGANSVVISDITEPGTYVGCPVRKVK